MSRLIDAYTEGYVEKSEFESRIGGLRERRQALKQLQQQLDEAVLSKADLRLIIGRLGAGQCRVPRRVNSKK